MKRTRRKTVRPHKTSTLMPYDVSTNNVTVAETPGDIDGGHVVGQHLRHINNSKTGLRSSVLCEYVPFGILYIITLSHSTLSHSTISHTRILNSNTNKQQVQTRATEPPAVDHLNISVWTKRTTNLPL